MIMGIVEELQEDLPSYKSIDPYAETMEWLFTICHVLFHKYGKTSIPNSWEYHESPLDKCLDFDEHYLIDLHGLHHLSRIDLIILGNHLIEFRNELEEKGMSY